MSATIPERLEEGVYAWVFGDGEDDPGLLVTEGRDVPEFLVWLGQLERQITSLKRALGAKTSESEALARLHALMNEIERAQPIVFPAGMEDVASPVVSMEQYRKKNRRGLGIAVAIVLAAAAAFVLVTRGGPGEPRADVSAEIAGLLTRDMLGDEGFGFGGGVEPSAHDRGFLVGAVIDLSRQRQSGSPPGAAELELARKLASRALFGLDAPDDLEARRLRALGGCAAILGDDPDRDDCEKGMMSYATARDNILH